MSETYFCAPSSSFVSSSSVVRYGLRASSLLFLALLITASGCADPAAQTKLTAANDARLAAEKQAEEAAEKIAQLEEQIKQAGDESIPDDSTDEKPADGEQPVAGEKSADPTEATEPVGAVDDVRHIASIRAGWPEADPRTSDLQTLPRSRDGR